MDATAKAILDSQLRAWETAFSEDGEMFGLEPSKPATYAAELFKKQGKTTILELGAGQGRDTLYFAKQGFHVWALEYTKAGAAAIEEQAKTLGLSHNITVIRHDVRQPLPFARAMFDACYSHMLYCMAFTTAELKFISDEVRRVLQADGINVYTVRTTSDKHYGCGIHHGEDIYEYGGFIVHFFDKQKIGLLANGYQILDVATFEEGELPRQLFLVTLKKLKMASALV